MKIPLPIPIPFPDWDEIIPPPRSPTRRDRPHHRSLLRYQLQKEKRRREVRWGFGGSHPEEEETKPLLIAPENLQKFLLPTSDLETERERERAGRLLGCPATTNYAIRSLLSQEREHRPPAPACLSPRGAVNCPDIHEPSRPLAVTNDRWVLL
jgi:hypothetical protein